MNIISELFMRKRASSTTPTSWIVTVWGREPETVTGEMDLASGVLWFRAWSDDSKIVALKAFPLTSVQSFEPVLRV